MISQEPTRRPWAAGDIVLIVFASGLTLALIVVGALIGVLSWTGARAAQQRIGSGTPVDLSEMIPGDCVAEFPFLSTLQSSYLLVDCASDHAAELVYRGSIDETTDGQLSVAATEELASSICDTTYRYHLHLDESVEADYPNAMLYGVYEGPAAWAQGANQFNCFLINSDGSPLTGQYFIEEDLD